MTSKQVMLMLVLSMGGCVYEQTPPGAEPLVSPYAERRVWAVAPLRNESGSLNADGLVMADHLARQLENASHVDVVPVNRVLRAMEVLELPAITTEAHVQSVMQLLNVDGLVVGSITAYDPYDPPKLGLAIELFDGGRAATLDAIDTRDLTRAATAEQSSPYARGGAQPMSRRDGVASGVSIFLDAATADVRDKLKLYGGDRGGENHHPEGWHRYRISMDLYSEFVSYVASWRLMRAEARRLQELAGPIAPAVPAPAATSPQASNR